MANPFVHVELNTTDVDRAKTFYGKLFEWKLEETSTGEMPYTIIGIGDGVGGGIMKQLIPSAESAWLPYVLVDDIAASTTKAQSLGATIRKEVSEVMGMGWLSILVDPTGAVFGLWKAKT